MKYIISGFLVICLALGLKAQQRCNSTSYTSRQLVSDPLLADRLREIEKFTSRFTPSNKDFNRTSSVPDIIRIPVIFHVLYRTPEENISEDLIKAQLEALNRDFRRMNPDTTLTPSYFKPVAADMQFEFAFAKSDPSGKNTNGIIRKYTAVQQWMMDDKMKFSSEYGSNAWDTKSYLNIWICNLQDAIGYSGFPGTAADVDGVVLDYRVIGNYWTHTQYSMGRTGVHEVGHWLNLKHIWGDEFCGSDDVDDTPKQSSYTPGCPVGIRSTCDNGPNGDMYMNYMDFTADLCLNMFTLGQKARARVLFEVGGPRHSMLYTKGFNDPVIYEAPLPDFYPTWMEAKIYPNPATSQITVYFEYDERWLGKQLNIIDINGRIVMALKINSKIQQIDISRLQPGMYFINTEKEKERVISKFVKL